MKRALTWSLVTLVVVLLALVSTVMMRAERTELLPPDPAMPIHLADGTTRTLADVLAAARDGEELPTSKPLVMQDPLGVLKDLTPEQRAAQEQMMEIVGRAVQAAILEEEGTVFRLAEGARHEGRLDEATALYLSVPEDDPRFSRARRRLAWDVMTKARHQPRRAVQFAEQAVHTDPFNGNSWHDLARVYGATLGLNFDTWD